ncbi:MAG: MazG-like family protein [Firmicutes bacterium]|nr:MazG-like family protein [Bacillota bacterium]
MIEWLKTELLSEVAGTFKAMNQDDEDSVADHLATVLAAAFILGKRLGISFARLDLKARNKIKANIESEHQIEQWFGDFSALLRYLEEGKR